MVWKCSCHWFSYCDLPERKNGRTLDCFLYRCIRCKTLYDISSWVNWHDHHLLIYAFPASTDSRETLHSISQLFVSSFFPLNRVRMALFRPFRLVWSLHVGQRCHLHPTSTYWETAVTASGQTRATASQISASARTMPALKEGFYFTHRRVSGNTRSHWLPVCWRLNTFMLIWGLHLCMQTLYVYVVYIWLWASLICCMLTGESFRCTIVSHVKNIWLRYKMHSMLFCPQIMCVVEKSELLLYKVIRCMIFRKKLKSPTDTHWRRNQSHIYRPEDQEQLFTHQTGIKHLETPKNTHGTAY